MKSEAELQSMTREELVEYAISLQSKLSVADSDCNSLRNKLLKESERFKSFRNMVKSVVELVEIPNPSNNG